MDDEFKDLQRLLSIKRHEAPPPEYFEDFLFEFQRRQRAELLKRPLWRLALDRLEGAIPNFSLSRYAYGSASALAVAAAMAVVTSGYIVAVPRTGGTAEPGRHVGNGLKVAAQKFDFNAPRHSFRLPETDFDQPRASVATYHDSGPRYILDTHPVSYAQSSSF